MCQEPNKGKRGTGKKGVRFISRIFAEWGQVHFSLHGERAQIHYCDATLIWHLSDCRPFTAGKQAACPASRSAGRTKGTEVINQTSRLLPHPSPACPSA